MARSTCLRRRSPRRHSRRTCVRLASPYPRRRTSRSRRRQADSSRGSIFYQPRLSDVLFEYQAPWNRQPPHSPWPWWLDVTHCPRMWMYHVKPGWIHALAQDLRKRKSQLSEQRPVLLSQIRRMRTQTSWRHFCWTAHAGGCRRGLSCSADRHRRSRRRCSCHHSPGPRSGSVRSAGCGAACLPRTCTRPAM